MRLTRSNALPKHVQDKFCSKQTQPFLQTDLPLHVHTKSCKKSDDIWPSNNIGSSRITMVNETCIFCGFKRSKCLKGCFYLWINLIKKNYKGTHEMYNDRSYLTFIYVSLWYTVWYYGSKSKHTRFAQHRYFCKAVFCQSLNSYEHCTSHVKVVFVLNRICPAQNFILDKH
jgi:hypothetical protein